MTASPKFSAFLPCYRGVLGKKEQLKQPFLSALHAQGVHWLQTWDISQNKQERVVLMVFVSMTRWCFTENRTVKERLRPTALHPDTLPVEVLPKWGCGRPTTSLKMVCEYCYLFPLYYVELVNLDAIDDVRARESKGKEVENGKYWILLDSELSQRRQKWMTHGPQFFVIFYSYF